MKYCVFCGREIDIESERCPYCHEDISDDVTSKVYHSNIRCIKCNSKNVDYKIERKEKHEIFYEEEVYTCKECGKVFTDKNRLGPSFSNSFHITIGRGTQKFLYILIVFGIVFGILYSNHLKGQKNENGTYYPYSIVDNVETTKDMFAIGEELYCENKTFVVNKVSYPKKVDGKSPSSGNKFITIEFTIKNTAKEPKLYNAGDIELKLSNGEKIKTKVKTDYTSERLDSNTSASGNTTLEIPANESNLVLNYYCDYWIDELIAHVDLSSK